MSWSRCSKVGLALLVLLATVAVPAVATDVAPSATVDRAEVGSDVEVTYELTNLFNDTNTDWTLNASTDLEEPTWTIARYDPQGNTVGDTQQATTATTTANVTSEVSRIEVTVQGTVAEASAFNFTFEPAQNTTVAAFERVQGNAVTDIHTDLAMPYTTDSIAARQALENATAAIEAARNAGAGVGEAEETFESARVAYDGENFDNAITLAERAQSEAESAEQSSEQQDTLLLVGAGVVVLLLLGGLVYWYLQQRDTYDELG